MSRVENPSVLWAQRSSAVAKEKNFIYLTVKVQGIILSTLRYAITDTAISLKSMPTKETNSTQYDVRSFDNLWVFQTAWQAFEKSRTPQSVTIVMFKKDISSRCWPQLAKTALPYVNTDFSRWTWEGDESDDMIESGSNETNDMNADSSSAGNKSVELLDLSDGSRVPPGAGTPAIPQVLWAQRSSSTEQKKNIIFLSVNAPDIAKSTLKYVVTETSISFYAYARKEYEEGEYAFDLDFYADVIPEVMEEHLTKQGFMIILLKKQMKSAYWPALEKTCKPYTRTDFKRWTWEGDENDDIDASSDIYSLGTNNEEHISQADELGQRGVFFAKRFERLRDLEDISESITCVRAALELRPAPHPNRAALLDTLGDALVRLVEQKGDFKDLEESIRCHREALELYPAPHPCRPRSLTNLGSALFRLFEQKGGFENLEECIQCNREALELIPAPHHMRCILLNNCANALQTLFEQKGNFGNLDECIQYHREALEAPSEAHLNRSTSLINLGGALFRRFAQKSDFKDLEESIQCQREALELLPVLDSNRSFSLSNLATALNVLFEQKGDFVNLEECIQCHREALELRPVPHPKRCDSVNGLGSALYQKFEEKRDIGDLEESLQCYRESLELRPAPHPTRSTSLNNLASALFRRFKQTKGFENLEECIQCYRGALELTPAPHPERSTTLDNFASALAAQSEQKGKGGSEDLEESIQCHREALDLRPAPHTKRSASLGNLGSALYRRFTQKGVFENLEESIACFQEALQILPVFHPHRVISAHLGVALMKLHSITSQPWHLEAAMDAFRAAVTIQSLSPLARFDAGKIWARHAHSSHPSELEAYQHTISLLPRLATLDLHLQARRDTLLNSDGLACDAASCAVTAGNLERAIEFLEAARGVFWSQSLQLRTPFDHLHSQAPNLAKKLQDLSNALEQGSFRKASIAAHNNQKQRMTLEQEANHFRRLDREWTCTLKEVRKLAGFQDFLLPKPFRELKRAASNRRIVLLNASKYGCDGLILSEGGVTHVPFPKITLQGAVFLDHLLQLALSPDETYSHISDEIHLMLQPMLDQLALSPDTTDSHIPDEIYTTLRSLSDRLKPKKAFQHHIVPGNRPEILQYILVILWITIVRPVIWTLGLQKSNSPPRLWWCPTGPFAFLPIHAAGIYDFSGNSHVDALDYIISSYTPTLSPLLAQASQLDENFSMLAIVEPSGLHYTLEELAKIKKWVLAEHLIALGAPESPTTTTVEDVLSHISKASIAHFACHGTQNNEKPLESALQVLPGDQVEISRIMELRLNASLAFLSACETATGDKKAPDETVHIAAAMLFAGFKSVVGTMWAIRDSDAPDVVDSVYRHLFKDGTTQIPDTTEAALALHLAVKKMRKETKCSFERWVPFIHLGL